MIQLRKLTTNVGTDEFKMIQEIGKGENGFTNNLYSDDFSIFQKKLLRNYEMSEEINLNLIGENQQLLKTETLLKSTFVTTRWAYWICHSSN